MSNDQHRQNASLWMDHILETWGTDETETMFGCCERLLKPYSQILDTWNDRFQDQLLYERPLILTGERTWLPEQMEALSEICARLFSGRLRDDGITPVDAQRPPPHLIFTGGVLDRPHTGELPGSKLARRFFSKLENQRWQEHTTVDNLARNTGDQGYWLTRVVKPHGFTTLVIVYPYDHLVRFTAVMLQGLRDQIGDAVNRISILPICYGLGDTVPANRAYDVSLAREAFGDAKAMTPEEEPMQNFLAQRGGQYTSRWATSCAKRREWICGSYYPSELLAHLTQQRVQL